MSSTRKGINDVVFSGEGITIAADKSIIGKEIKIDPKTGDTSAIALTILQMKSGKETLAAAQRVG